jgi:type IV pilus assembly protein PilY1
MRSLVSSTSPMTVSLRQWTFDSNPVVVLDGANDNPTTLADASSPGWAIYYNPGPQIATDEHLYIVNPLDERTSSVSGLYGKVLWNTIQPALSEATTTVVGCKQSKCQAAFRRLSYHYAADAITGGPVLRDASGNLLRALVQNTLVPAQGDQPTVFVNQKGQIAVGLTAVNPEKGASNLGMGPAMDPVVGLGVVEVSQDLHDCRHAPSAVGVAAPDASKCK